MSGRMRFVWGLSLLLLASSAGAQQAASRRKPEESTLNSSPLNKPVTPDDPNYVIGAQDVLDISVWKEPDLTRTVPVRPDGKISMPLLNDVQAAGLTPLQLATQITTGLRKFVNE